VAKKDDQGRPLPGRSWFQAPLAAGLGGEHGHGCQQGKPGQRGAGAWDPAPSRRRSWRAAQPWALVERPGPGGCSRRPLNGTAGRGHTISARVGQIPRPPQAPCFLPTCAALNAESLCRPATLPSIATARAGHRPTPFGRIEFSLSKGPEASCLWPCAWGGVARSKACRMPCCSARCRGTRPWPKREPLMAGSIASLDSRSGCDKQGS